MWLMPISVRSKFKILQSSRINLAKHLNSYPLIKFFVCLIFQFAAITKFILSTIKMSGEPPAQFDGLYKIA